MLNVLLLKEDDVKQLLTVDDVLEAVEAAFREKALGRVQMPSKVYLFYSKHGGDLRVMPSYMESLDASAVKIVNSHPKNRERGFPTVMATIVTVDPKTGAPLCIMGGTWITAMRTGAAVGVATKYLARKNSRKLGLVGAGVQASTQLMAVAHVAKLDEVRVYDKDEVTAESFVQKMQSQYSGMKIVATETVQEAVGDADIICTSTPSKQPVLKSEWVKRGVHINAMGADAPGKQEIEPLLLEKGKIVVDDLEQSCHCGEVNVSISTGIFSKEKIYGELGEIVAGKKQGRVSEEEITIFDSTGLALQDLVTARLAYLKAVDRGLGTQFNFI
jgi:alanine dehydrogenase